MNTARTSEVKRENCKGADTAMPLQSDLFRGYSCEICAKSLLDIFVPSGKQIAPSDLHLFVGGRLTSMACCEVGCIVMTQP